MRMGHSLELIPGGVGSRGEPEFLHPCRIRCNSPLAGRAKFGRCVSNKAGPQWATSLAGCYCSSSLVVPTTYHRGRPYRGRESLQRCESPMDCLRCFNAVHFRHAATGLTARQDRAEAPITYTGLSVLSASTRETNCCGRSGECGLPGSVGKSYKALYSMHGETSCNKIK